MNAIFTGRKRSGKTTLAFDMAMRSDGGIIIYDPKREFRGWPATTSDVADIEGFIKNHHDVIVFHPVGSKREAFTPLVKMVGELHRIAMAKGWDKTGDHFTLIVDEAVNVSTAQWIDHELLSLVAENRPEILSIYLTFQSPMDANNLLKSRVDHWYIFNTSLPGDLDYLNKKIGVPEDDLEAIKNLRDHEYAEFSFDGGQPVVEYKYEPDEWFRPLEFFELNQNEREEVMARERNRDESKLSELFEDFLDWMDDRKERRERNSGGNREREGSGEREREREPRARRERSYNLDGY